MKHDKKSINDLGIIYDKYKHKRQTAVSHNNKDCFYIDISVIDLFNFQLLSNIHVIIVDRRL